MAARRANIPSPVTRLFFPGAYRNHTISSSDFIAAGGSVSRFGSDSGLTKRSDVVGAAVTGLVDEGRLGGVEVGERQGFVEVQQPPVLNRRHLVEIQL